MKKVVLVGTGMVGMSFAYAALNQNVFDELVLIDLNKQRAIGEAMDLNHGLAFSKSSMRIYAGEYSDCKDADIVIICAGVAQKPGETRPQLLNRNTAVFKSVVKPVCESGFNGIFLVATNPVDIMTRVTAELSGFPKNRVIGTGTTLDSARLRYLLGEYFGINTRSIHAYVIGEHGDTEFIPWSQALLATKPVNNIMLDNPTEYKLTDLQKMEDEVRRSAYKIIESKGATYYGIGMAIVQICRAILQNENSVLTVSCHLDGQYGQYGTYVGVPAIINKNGVKELVELSLTGKEMNKLIESCNILNKYYSDIELNCEEKAE
ncbi:MAG: L-lactate dehydrogenase [Ruminococcus sp.]|nr:L-lactate dehydrogenase [Ruminococcus sp.]